MDKITPLYRKPKFVMVFPFQNYRIFPDMCIQYVEQITAEVHECIKGIYIDDSLQSASARLLPKYKFVYRSLPKKEGDFDEEFWSEEQERMEHDRWLAVEHLYL